ncbi:MAG TPA: hypothetical protein VG225_11355 [Terracidiphilus sp.]|jgi:hypothetical protein|nr:hypothetical protein [Terracidiphilus sp.]
MPNREALSVLDEYAKQKLDKELFLDKLHLSATASRGSTDLPKASIRSDPCNVTSFFSTA